MAPCSTPTRRYHPRERAAAGFRRPHGLPEPLSVCGRAGALVPFRCATCRSQAGKRPAAHEMPGSPTPTLWVGLPWREHGRLLCVRSVPGWENPCGATAFEGLTLTRSARRASARRRARSWPRIVATGSTACRWTPPGLWRARWSGPTARDLRMLRVNRPCRRRATCGRVKTIDWALISPRPRTAFWTICLFILGKGERTDGAGHLVLCDHRAGHGGMAADLAGRQF